MRFLSLVSFFSLLCLLSTSSYANLRDLIGNTWLRACIYDTKDACEENDCVWTTECVLPDLSGKFCIGLSKDECGALHVCRWSGKRCIGKTRCDVKCASFETQDYCRPGKCIWSESEGCVDPPKQNAKTLLATALVTEDLVSPSEDDESEKEQLSSSIARLDSFIRDNPEDAAKTFGFSVVLLLNLRFLVSYVLDLQIPFLWVNLKPS